MQDQPCFAIIFGAITVNAEGMSEGADGKSVSETGSKTKP